jgi:homoserine O-acetyltransferase
MMDLHDVGRRRGGVERALRRIRVPTLNASISSDTLYPPHQQQRTHEELSALEVDSRYHLIQSPHGHDGFLIETDAMSETLSDFLEEMAKTDG